MNRVLVLPVLLAAAFLAGCAGEGLKDGSFVTTLAPPDRTTTMAMTAEEYRIGASDKLNISVFPAKEFSLPSTRVDAVGSILVPPVGAMQAQGKTARELARDIEAKLGACCLQRPQVVVLVEEAISQQVAITGAVVQSDVYSLRSRTTLLQAITMAKGPDRTTANLKRVAVYRTTNGQRTAALFNVEEIRKGKAPDPEIYGGDIIIVDSSDAKSAWRTAVSAVPLMGIFTVF